MKSSTKTHHEIREAAGEEAMAKTMALDWQEIRDCYPEIFRILVTFKDKICIMDDMIECLEVIVDEHILKKGEKNDA